MNKDHQHILFKLLITLLLLCLPFSAALASEAVADTDLTTSIYGILAVIVFISAYSLVIGEEFPDLKKSKPVFATMTYIHALDGRKKYLCISESSQIK